MTEKMGQCAIALWLEILKHHNFIRMHIKVTLFNLPRPMPEAGRAAKAQTIDI